MHMKITGVMSLAALWVLPSLSAAQLPPAAEQMAQTFGLDSFEKIEAIRFTWGIEGTPVSRSWEWQPKTDTVTYEVKDKEGKVTKATYQRSQLDSQSDDVKKNVDPNFLNDQYWLLLPLHAASDGATVTDEGQQQAPLAKTSADKIVVKYAGGGYSPGDTWDIYVGADHRIVEMTYHRAVPVPGAPNVVMATWAGYQKAGPLLVSTDHPTVADGHDAHIVISNVAVKMKGSKGWIKAH
jgi:hypothetical protein